MKMHHQEDKGRDEPTRPTSCPNFRSPSCTSTTRRPERGTTPRISMLSQFMLMGMMMMADPRHYFMGGVAAFVPSTPSSQQHTTTTSGSSSSIPQPLRKLRPCHDINSDDPLFVLGLTTKIDPNKEDIKRAYKYLVTFYHPDAIADLQSIPEKQEASARFAKINAAYREALQHLVDMEQQREAAVQEEAQRLAELEKLSDNPFNWALRTGSMNKDHVTAQSRFEYVGWKMGQPQTAASPANNGPDGRSSASTATSQPPPSRKVHIRRRDEPPPDKTTVDPFTWATSVNTGL
jgi:DnaJ-domain-containing protein 1